MIIIQLAGGLGNQMFQYALYLQLKNSGKTVKIDDVSGFLQDGQRNPALAPFGAAYERASREELEEMLDCSPLLRHKIRRKLCGRKKKAYFEADKHYKPEIMGWDDIYLEGYWQTEKYFQEISDQVKAVFDTDRLLDYLEKAVEEPERRSAANRTLQGFLKQIVSAESVSVHVRRGDYLLPENQALFGNICTEAYYRTAMEQMNREHPDCTFYLFTNDKEWAQEWIAGRISPLSDRCRVMDLSDFEDENMAADYAEFVLMSRCRHNILANSSFSWWASYLNKNPHKTVFAPDRWLNGWDCRDFYRTDMHKIPSADILGELDRNDQRAPGAACTDKRYDGQESFGLEEERKSLHE